VLDGTVRVTLDRHGASEELNVLGPGEFFGLIALVDDAPRSANCIASGDVTVASLPESAFRLLFNTHAPVAFALQRALADQLARDFRNLDRRIRALRG
jgi:CRP-like cAMP-binding protein